MMWLAQPLLRRKLHRRSRQEPGYALAIEERFGNYAAAAPPHAGHTLWLHAVSLGETRAAAPLITELHARLPNMRLLLTHGTATGRAEGAKLLRQGDLQAWLPWDTPAAVARFLAHFRPDLGVLMETEIWPNLVAGCQAAGVKLVLANARFSDKSLRQSQRMAWLARPAYAALTAVLAQTPPDAQRLTQMGASVTAVLGNLKFDATPDAAQLARGRAWRAGLRQPVIMFASSREGEELALLSALKSFRPLAHVEKGLGVTNSIANQGQQPTAHQTPQTVQWLIAPRHPQRFDAVAALIESHGFAVQRRSRWGELGPPPATARATSSVATTATDTAGAPHAVPPQPTVWLGDSLGEMALYYALADVALLGGSFEPLGGQNLIEAAACGCPVVMGPHTFNFADAAEQAQAAGAALRAADLPEAADLACRTALTPSAHSAMVQACVAFSEANRGAVAQTAGRLAALLAANSKS